MEQPYEKDQFESASEISEEGYTPRPVWQVWGARIGLVLFILFVIWQLIQIASGGQL